MKTQHFLQRVHVTEISAKDFFNTLEKNKTRQTLKNITSKNN